MHQQRAVLGTAVGTPVPRELLSSLLFQQLVYALFSTDPALNLLLPGVISFFKGCLTGQAFLLIETLREAAGEGGKREEL